MNFKKQFQSMFQKKNLNVLTSEILGILQDTA